jgi:transposase InsO family protein
MHESPPISITDNAVADISNVSSKVPNHHLIDLYAVGDDHLEKSTQPFVHTVELKGEKGITSKVRGLFDDGAMVNSICNSIFPRLRNTLGVLTPSPKTLRMADGTRVPSNGRWFGNVTVGGQTVKEWFEVFPSGGGWSLLFGKPLLKKFNAIHDYGNDTIMIPSNGTWTTLTNECDESLVSNGESANILKGDANSPSRQVLSLILDNAEHVDKQSALELLFNTPQDVCSISTQRNQQRLGRRARKKQKRKTKQHPLNPQEWWNSVGTVSDATNDVIEGDLQPEVDIGGDHSLFTRATDPHNPRRVAEVLKHVSIGSDLSDVQRDKVRDLISEFADCFALSVREVLPIPGAEHRIHIPPDATFPKKIPHQRQLTEAQRAYLSDAVDELLAADIIESIRPEDVKCASPITLAQKVHTSPGLSYDELRHRVNAQCITQGHPPAHNVEAPPHEMLTPVDNSDITYDPTQPQKWRICQNYGALNRVTQVFPMPQGDIRTKQRRLSGHRWVHGFDFASGFYAITIPKECRPYLAFYVEGRGFKTQKRMPFGLTGAPSTFAHVIGEKIGDLLPKLNIELLVDDGGMAGDDFENMMDRTRQFLTRIRKTSLSLSAKKSEFFMSEIIFAGARVNPHGVQPDSSKLTAIVDWRQPPDLLNLSRFLGLAGYFRDLVKGYAKIAQPLSDLVRGAAIPKGAGKAAYRAALTRVKLANIWTPIHERAFLGLKKVLTSEPVLKAPRFDGTPFIVTSDGCKEGFGGMLAQRFRETRTGGKVIEKLHPIAYASKRTSPSEANYKPFLLEFAALKFCMDKFDSIIWGFPVEIETDCQALRDTMLSDNLNATHARWRDGVLSHQIVDVRHIPGRINLVGDGLSRKDEDLPHVAGDGSSWSVLPDWETARGLEYDLFSVDIATSTIHSTLRERFANERVFLEVIDALLGITKSSTDSERKRAMHRAEGYFIENGKLWRLGGATPTRSVARRECVTKLEATQLAREEHAKLHMRRDLIKTQLLDKIYSPLLDASITTAILECGRCKNFGSMHIHALLAPITRRQPFELLVGDYLSMPTGKGGFTKIGLYADVFSRKLWGFKSKSAAGKNTVDSLRKISQTFVAPGTLMVDGGSHFDCGEVRDYCKSIGTKLHIVAAYAPWLNGLLEGSNGILLNALKRLCAPGLGEDDYDRMATKDIPSNWPIHLDAAIKNLSDRILPSLKYSPNELLLGLVVNSRHTDTPDEIELPTEEDINIHLSLVEQQRLDGYAAIVDHAAKRKLAFDTKLRQRAPRVVEFQPGDLVQVHATEWIRTFASIKKLIPMWSIPHRVATRKLNSYTLETLGGLPLAGVYNARRLRLFEPREGTQLAMNELARMETVEGEEEVQLED